MEVFHKIVSFLDNSGVEYSKKVHGPTLTSKDSARERGDKLSEGAKAIVYKIHDEFFLFVFPADQKMDPKKIKVYFKSQGKRVKKTRFATSEELKELTGLVPGSIPPFGPPILPFNLFVDPTLQKNDKISFNAGSLTNSISMSLNDYIKVSSPEIFDFIL